MAFPVGQMWPGLCPCPEQSLNTVSPARGVPRSEKGPGSVGNHHVSVLSVICQYQGHHQSPPWLGLHLSGRPSVFGWVVGDRVLFRATLCVSGTVSLLMPLSSTSSLVFKGSCTFLPLPAPRPAV